MQRPDIKFPGLPEGVFGMPEWTSLIQVLVISLGFAYPLQELLFAFLNVKGAGGINQYVTLSKVEGGLQ